MGSYLADQASDEEYRIREALKNVGLFFELNLDEDELRRAQELFGRLVAQEAGTGTEATLIRRYPALTLTTMVGHAGLSYEQGRYWDSFWDELGLDRNQEFEAQLRHALFRLLQKFALREFPDLPGRTYVMAMALHAGIPVHCLSDLVDVIEEHVQHGRDATGAAVLEWLTEPGMDYRLGRLDVPVRNFLALGGETAVNILDRIIEFLVFTLEHPGVWNDLELETATTGLPTLILNGLIERLRGRPFLADADESATRRALRRRSGPSITYSLDADEVCIGVPYPETGGDSPWKVTAGGTAREIFAERGWGVDDGEHPLTSVSITRPAREVVMRHEASDATYRVPVFDSADPLLLFSSDGRLTASRSVLPRGVVFAMHPKDATVVDAVTREEIRAAGDAVVPSGWTGWRLYPLDLASHASIVLQRAGTEGVVRGVRSVGSPSFYLEEPIPGVHTPSGLGVYAHRPAVDLPPYVGDEPVAWRVRTRRVGDRRWLTDCEWDSDTEVTTLDPFDGVEKGALLGQYEVIVSGELGSDQRRTLVMAEGLTVDHEVPFRRPVVGGLTPSICVIGSEFGVPIATDVLEFEASDREKDIRVGSAGHAYKLVVRPPHFEFRIDESGTPAQWRSSSLASSPSDFERHGVVAVRVPNVRSVRFALRGHQGEVLQSENQERSPNNVFQVASRAFADTARRASVSRLVAIVESLDGSRDEITLADIRPARLCSAISLDGHDLVFEGLADTEDLGVWVWSATAPWTPVTRLAIDNNRATLPDDLHDAGDLISEVFADDPFAVISRPLGPSCDAIRVHQSGWKRHADAALDALAQFLAGVGKPPLVAAAADGAWAALALLPWDKTDSTSERLRGGLIQIVLKYPRSALEALGNSVIPQDAMMALLINTHLVDRPYSASFTLNDLHQNPFVGCMVEIADLPALRAQGPDAATERAETLAYLKSQGGEDLIALLRSGKMLNPREGVFSRSDLAYDSFSDEKVTEIFEYARLVPGPLLDPDTRTSAAFEVFNRRREWTADPIARELASHVSRALAAVKKASPALYDAIKARDELLDGVDTAEHPWMLLSVQSLTLAAVARLESRGEFEYPPMTSDMRDIWSVLAGSFPAMVAGDLLIAEALAAHAVDGDLIGDGS